MLQEVGVHRVRSGEGDGVGRLDGTGRLQVGLEAVRVDLGTTLGVHGEDVVTIEEIREEISDVCLVETMPIATHRTKTGLYQVQGAHQGVSVMSTLSPGPDQTYPEASSAGILKFHFLVFAIASLAQTPPLNPSSWILNHSRLSAATPSQLVPIIRV